MSSLNIQIHSVNASILEHLFAKDSEVSKDSQESSRPSQMSQECSQDLSTVPEQSEQIDFSPLHHDFSVPENVQKNKFVNRTRANATHDAAIAGSKVVPADIRHWAEILEVDFENITGTDVQTAWRKLMASPAVHPDLGGDAELAIVVTRAKDELLKWVELQTPKLGKQFSHLAK